MAIRSLSLVLVVLAAGALGAACGAAPPPPTARIASTQAAIRAARELGAERTPQAALHLKYANDQFADAQHEIQEERTDRAEMILRCAESDAELALVLARQRAAEAEARRVEEQVRAVRTGQ